MHKAATVDWHAYAEAYDLMAEHNPPYQDLITRFKGTIAQWPIASGSVLADLGAGTGNFSIELAQAFPECRVTHLDASAGMNQIAKRKAGARSVTNLEFVTTDLDSASFPSNSVAAITTVHALYAFPNPKQAIARMFDWLEPGGFLFACDAGRMAGVSKWTPLILREFYRRQGLWGTARSGFRVREILNQNRRIVQASREGAYWTHSHAEFREAIESAGFIVLAASEVYLGSSDLVVALKPQSKRGPA